MNTIGYLFIMVAAILLRAVARGRAGYLPEDIQDTFVAVLTGDAAKLKEVAARRGEGLEAVTPVIPSSGAGSGAVSNGSGSDLLARCRALGGAAKGYRIGATGPDYYDCSGLVWRAGKEVGMYTGPRFTTSTFARIASSFSIEVNSGASGDIVLWPSHHMGVVTSGGSFYSALSSRSGIREIGIDTINGTPRYFRIK